jgi:hypothetical protein
MGFYFAHNARSQAEGWAGLGLAIAKLAIERHGSRIELDSETSRGSTFRICCIGKSEPRTAVHCLSESAVTNPSLLVHTGNNQIHGYEGTHYVLS